MLSILIHLGQWFSRAVQGHSGRGVCCGLLGCRLLLAWLVPAASGPLVASEPPDGKLQWTLAQSDGSVRLLVHRQLTSSGPQGSGCEAVRIRGSNASYVHMVRSIDPSFAIQDLQIDLPVRADQRGVELWARVAFPRSSHPASGRPLTSLIAGDRYERVGEWQALTVRQVRNRMQMAAKVLRHRFSTGVDEAGAYVDALVLNVYTGPGVGETWIGNPRLEGLAPVGIRQLAAWELERGSAALVEEGSLGTATVSTSAAAPWRIGVDGGQLLQEGRPRFFRAVTYRGESCRMLANCGFNAVVFLEPPSASVLEEAVAAGLCWLGPAAGDDVPAALYQSRLVAQPVAPHGDPTPAVVESDQPSLKHLGRHTMRLVAPARSVRAADYVIEVSTLAQLELARRDEAGMAMWKQATEPTVHWAALPLQAPPLVLQQARSLGAPKVAPFVLDADALRRDVRRAIAADCRGIWFQTNGSLEACLQVSSIQRINGELQLIEPWIAGGHRLGPASLGGDVVLQWQATTLVLPQSSHFPLGRSDVPWHGTLHLVSPSPTAYRVALHGLQRIAVQRTAGGIQLAAIETRQDAAYLITSDSRSVQQLSQRAQQLSGAIWDTELRRLEAQLLLFGQLPAWLQDTERRTSILARLGRGRRLFQQGDARQAFTQLQQAQDLLDGWQRHALRTVIVQNPTVRGSICSHYLPTLPAALALEGLLDHRTATGNLLVGGSCDDPAGMHNAGWQLFVAGQRQQPLPLRATRRVRREGSCAIRLTTSGDAATDGDWVCLETPAVVCQPGDVLRISGWVYSAGVPPASGATPANAGFRLHTSWDPTTALVQLPWVAGWQPFDHYLVVGEDDSITFQLCGLATTDQYVDQLELIRYPAESQLARRTK